MSWLLIFVAIVVVQAAPNEKPQFEPFSDELIHYINEKSGASWKAAPSSRFINIEHFKQHLGLLEETPEERQTRRPTVRYNVSDNDLPESFDAREKWPLCRSIRQIPDQSSCGSCWAVAGVGAMSDRVCIHSNGMMQPELSAIDLVSCCSYCGNGCQGGSPPAAWDYWWRNGIVTGGTLENPTGCLPYPFPQCRHPGSRSQLNPCPGYIYPTPSCYPYCQAGYDKTYEKDKVYGKTSYNVDRHEYTIMEEIMKNGPVEAGFIVYTDFAVYKSGIYHHVSGRYAGKHAIRIIGWGVENGVKYWLIANSWNVGWGENGYFRMLRGTDECRIESIVVAGMPRLQKNITNHH
ncbi:Vitellogenic cathepsin-B like protease [Fasciola hepatica]|uniref:Cathepsin B-like cysteine proteinase n=1 Tax=Fasciola hepatica TaxID=6192 RepID=A0A4E0RNG2_FASHE|nr:Vitellogenic cathepsin-B like protease [Fasciola hepatica]